MTAVAWALLAAAPAFGPFPSPQHAVTREATFQGGATSRAPVELHADFFEVAYEFYRQWVSPIDGPRCSHRPTCSRYGVLAVRRHGAVGLLLTMDRLLREDESSALRKLRAIPGEGGFHLLDPLEESTFWFSRSH
jgi:hypothetical protein